MLKWPSTIEIAWVDLGCPYPGSYKQEILAYRGQKVRSRSTGAIQSCTANGLAQEIRNVHVCTTTLERSNLSNDNRARQLTLDTWPCTIEIAWVDLGRPDPGSYKQEILANRGHTVRSRSTGAIQSCTANGLILQRQWIVTVRFRIVSFKKSITISFVEVM